MQTITFSEQPYGTIDPVYHCKTNTISFFGTVVTDSAQPDSPVLAYDQSFLGPVSFTFSDPVSHVSFDVGYFDDLLTTNVSFYDSLGNLLDSEDNFQFGIEHYSLDSLTGIARVVITPLSEDPAGFSVDSISFTNEPQQVFASGNQDIDGLLWGYKWDHKKSHLFLSDQLR